MLEFFEVLETQDEFSLPQIRASDVFFFFFFFLVLWMTIHYQSSWNEWHNGPVNRPFYKRVSPLRGVFTLATWHFQQLYIYFPLEIPTKINMAAGKTQQLSFVNNTFYLQTRPRPYYKLLEHSFQKAQIDRKFRGKREKRWKTRNV